MHPAQFPPPLFPSDGRYHRLLDTSSSNNIMIKFKNTTPAALQAALLGMDAKALTVRRGRGKGRGRGRGGLLQAAMLGMDAKALAVRGERVGNVKERGGRWGCCYCCEGSFPSANHKSFLSYLKDASPPPPHRFVQYTVVLQCLGVLAKAQSVQTVMQWCELHGVDNLGPAGEPGGRHTMVWGIVPPNTPPHTRSSSHQSHSFMHWSLGLTLRPVQSHSFML